VVSLVLRDPGTRDSALAQVARLLPGGTSGDAFQELRRTVDAIRESTGLLGAVGLAGLLWSGSALFSTIEIAFSRLLGFPRRDFVRGKLVGFGMILVFAVLVLLGIGVSAGLALITPIAERLGGGDVVSGPSRYIIQAAVGILIGVLLNGFIYFLVPRPRPRLRTVLPGALVAGVGFEVLSLIWPLYLTIAGSGNRYGQTFGLLVVLVSYVYLLAQLLMLGAVVNAVLEDRRRPAARPAESLTGRAIAPAAPGST
jgi:membrane protein